MNLLISTAALLLPFLATQVTAAPAVAQRETCTNSATDRACWGDYSLSTNYYDVVPDTGVTREYWLELVNTTLAPDGISRNVLTVNGTIPGPTLIADWGDTVIVHVYNGLKNNGTSIHFHGIRQNYTNQMDGVSSITQCPTAPGESITYTWRATQYGHSWYHSHYSLQAWEGVFGGILINGPTTANYDTDGGVLFIGDWNHRTVDELFIEDETVGPPDLDNGLINGTNIWNDTTTDTILGERFEINFTAGESIRLRLINPSLDSMYKFMIDNHTLTVVATDFVPIVPYNTTYVSIGIGQRYDIIINADQPEGDYWMRGIFQGTCSTVLQADNVRGIVRYDSSSTAVPTTTEYAYTDDCLDEDSANLVPYVPITVGAESVEDEFGVAVEEINGYFKWTLNGTAFLSEWDYPTLLAINDGNTSWTAEEHVISLPTANEWVYFVIESTAGAHPIHLHGHDFNVIASGTGTYASAKPTLTLTGAPRRDVVMVPQNGYVVMAFITDNPGAWLMHCHIGYHTAEGLVLQLVERESEISALLDTTVLTDTCTAWDAYVKADDIVQDDSGV